MKDFSNPTFVVQTNRNDIWIKLEGDMFRFKTNAGLFLSSSSFDGTEQYFNFYSNIKSVSSSNSPFYAYPLSSYEVDSNNIIRFKLPPRTKQEKLDFIFANDAGYRLASWGPRFTYIQVVSSL
jgi:hypothetical protein